MSGASEVGAMSPPLRPLSSPPDLCNQHGEFVFDESKDLSHVKTLSHEAEVVRGEVQRHVMSNALQMESDFGNVDDSPVDDDAALAALMQRSHVSALEGAKLMQERILGVPDDEVDAYLARFGADDDFPTLRSVASRVADRTVFPVYDATVSMSDLLRGVSVMSSSENDIVEQMQQKGYPDFWIEKFVKMTFHNESGKRDVSLGWKREASSRRVSNTDLSRQLTKSAKSESLRNVAKGAGYAPPLYWKVPIKAYTGVYPKPTFEDFSTSKFRRWVDSCAAALSRGLTDSRDFVSCDEFTHSLYLGRFAGGPKALKLSLPKARLYVIRRFTPEVEYRSGRPGFIVLKPKSLAKFGLTLSVRGARIASVTELAQIEAEFRKHKPLYRASVSFFNGDLDSAQAERLQDKLYEVLPPIYQGQTHSHSDVLGMPTTGSNPIGHFTLRHEVMIPGLTELLKSMTMYSGDDSLARRVTQVGSFIMAVSKSTDWLGAIACVLQFVSGNNVLWSLMKTAFDAIPYGYPTFQNGFWDSNFCQALGLPAVRDFFTVTVAGIVTHVFTDVGDIVRGFLPSVTAIVLQARAEMMKDMAKSLAGAIMYGVHECIARISRCIEMRSFSPLWGEAWDPRRWVRTVESLMTYYPILTATGAEQGAVAQLEKLVAAGTVPKWFTAPMTIGAFVELLESYYSQGKQLMYHFRSQRELTVELNAVNHRLRLFVDTLHAALNASNERVCPFMLLLYGVPGGGKTILANQMAQALGRVHGYDTSPAGRYIWQEGVNFQDGLSHNHWCVHFDDVDQGVAKDQAGVRNFVQNIIALVNNNPMPVEAADVALKGKIRASPRLVTYCSNFANGNLKDHTLQPTAFWRRVSMRVRVSAKDEFSSGNGVLDKQLAEMSETYDMYDLYVSFFDAKSIDPSNSHVIPFTEERKVSFTEMMDLYHLKYKEHIESQLRLLQARGDAYSRYCRDCGLPCSTQKCVHIPVFPVVEAEYQGQTWSRATSRCRRQTVKWLYSGPVARIDYLMTQFTAENIDYFIKRAGTAALVSAAIGLLFTAYQSRQENVSDGLVPKGWFRVDQDFKPGLPPSSSVTFTKEDIDIAVVQSLVRVFVDGKEIGFGFVLSQNTVLFPTHYVTTGTIKRELRYGVMLKFVLGGRDVQCQMTAFNARVLPSNTEMMIVRCGELKGSVGILGKMWVHDDRSVESFDEVEVVHERLLGVTKANGRYWLDAGPGWQCAGVETVFGDCGAVYIARHGKTWRIIGMHYQRLAGINAALGAIVTGDECKRVINTLGAVYQGVATSVLQLTRSPEQLEFLPFPVKSEVWVAVTRGAKVYGFGEVWPPMKGSTMKTKMQWSLICDDVRNLELEFCGTSPYWQMPEFRGSMREGEWVSPYTEVFRSQNLAVPEQRCLWLALADYLSGIELLDTQGWRELSEHEVVRGVPGSYIHAMNLKTSVGPPFNTSKRNHFVVSSEEAFASPDVLRIFDDLRGLLEGHVPAAVGMCTLKDEPVKPGKKPRVFTCLSAAYNMLLKQKLAPVKAFMRSNRTFFESWVGVDMTSKEASELVAFLKAVDPSLTRLEDGDISKLDKSYNGELFDFVALVFYSCAWHIGLKDPSEVHRLILGVKHCRFIIKGDVFSVFWNPSGHDATVEVNGVVVSLAERYAYYRTVECSVTNDELCEFISGFFKSPQVRFSAKLSFRENIALGTYGDDFVKANHLAYVPSSRYYDIWRDEIGMVMTDASKSGEMRMKSLSEIQFLKRRFVWSDEYKRYLTPLDMKSLVRTLVIKRESILSLRDHACVAMSEVLREMVYHGEQQYDRFLSLFEALIVKHELRPNAYLRIFPYEHWRRQLLEGTFVAWEPRMGAGDDVTPLTDFQSVS